jgi:hypothetical protein
MSFFVFVFIRWEDQALACFLYNYKKEEVGYAVLSKRKDCYFAWRSRGRLAERLFIERGGMNVFDFEEIELVF